MKTYTTETTVYSFEELTEEAKQRAIENERNDNDYLSYDWWDSVKDDLTMIADIMGIEIRDSFFTGFWSQGDGACFIGTYAYKTGSVKKIKEYAPKDAELLSIAQSLQKAQKPYFYKLTANITHRDNYYHSNSASIEVSHNDDISLPIGRNYNDLTGVGDALRGLMDWYYKQLENGYNYLMSDEAIGEHLESNEVEFTEEGKVYY